MFYGRLMRGEIMVQRQRDYAAAGRVMGYGWARILFRHLLPNAITPVLVYWMTDMALAILLGSSLGYLGLGAQPPTAEWGVLIADGKNFMTTAWWMSVFPGLAIVLAGIGFSLLGDGLADRWCGGDDTALLEVRGLASSRSARRSRSTAYRSRWTPARCWASSASSGSGKSLTLRAILRLLPSRAQASGVARWRDRDLLGMPEGEIRRIRGREIAMIFQEPMTALNPVLPIGLQIDESLAEHRAMRGAAARRRAIELLDLVGIPGCRGGGWTTTRTNSPAACASAR